MSLQVMSPIFSVISIAIISNVGIRNVIISIVVVSARVPGSHVMFECVVQNSKCRVLAIPTNIILG
jgi:hypothetical protein